MNNQLKEKIEELRIRANNVNNKKLKQAILTTLDNIGLTLKREKALGIEGLNKIIIQINEIEKRL